MKRKKAGLLILATLIISSCVYAQKPVRIKKREFKINEQTESFKEAWKSIKDGSKYFEAGEGTYPMALDHYLFANQYNNSNAALNYKIGLCYLNTEEKARALDHLLKAYELNNDVSTDIKFLIGKAYHFNLEFDKAIEFYNQHNSSLHANQDMIKQNAAVEKLIIECTHGKELLQSPVRVMLENLIVLNSGYDDYNPRFSYGDTAMFYTSRRPLNKKSKRSELDNKYNEDIYISRYVNEKFGKPDALGKPFFTKGNESLVGVDPAGEFVLMYVGGEDGGDIQKVVYKSKNGKWKKPSSMSKHINSKYEETTATFTPDGKKMYFISSNQKLSTGGKDIFVLEMNEKGRWKDPRNLGSLINSKYDEEGVFITNDGKTMYFASKGHNSMGGYDIFRSELDEEGYWAPPENLGYPINTPEDEVFYVTDSTGIYGYYSTIREDGQGRLDLYKVVWLGSEKELKTLPAFELVAGLKYDEFDPLLTMPEPIEADTSLLLSGIVRDTVGGRDTVVMAVLSFMDTSSGGVVQKTMSGPDGMYKARLPEAKVYGIEINASGYLYYLDMVDLSETDKDKTARADFYLERIEVGTKVVLDNIYFETGKAILTIDSYKALDQVYRFMENNGSIRLEISGHTDNTGSKQLNERLSEARAKSVVDYIVNRGINESRLEYKGYADSQPVATNDTEDGREMNRRVEFKILSK